MEGTMKNPYLIRFWHGRPDPNSHFAKKVHALCRQRPEDGVYFWDGSLEDFSIKWADKFIYLPAIDGDEKYITGIIGITPHGSFGAR
jgi:hypothetical protein